MNNKKLFTTGSTIAAILLLLYVITTLESNPSPGSLDAKGTLVTATQAKQKTSTPTLLVNTPGRTNTPLVIPSLSPSALFTLTNTNTPINTPSGNVAPFPEALLCPDGAHFSPSHDIFKFHTLWDGVRGCHYDHEHGYDPYTQQTTTIFAPLGDIKELGCGKEISHCVPSSPMEPTMKGTGIKWQVGFSPHGCVPFTGLQGNAVTGVDYYAIQYHFFANSFRIENNQMAELDSRIHSAVAVLRQCQPSNPNDFGYVYVEQFQDFGQRLRFYQGPLLPYPSNVEGVQANPIPSYQTNIGPYIADTCLGNLIGCRTSLGQAQRNNNNSIWTSQFRNGLSSVLFFQLFRSRDNQQVVDATDSSYPFTSYYLCTNDGGQTYNPEGCRYNSTTSFIHEIGGNIVLIANGQSIDNTSLDLDPRPGRLTFTGFVTRFGDLALECEDYGVDCMRIKLVSAFVGKYGSQLIFDKNDQFKPISQPERDIYFCDGVVCSEVLPDGTINPNAIPSGWIGLNN